MQLTSITDHQQALANLYAQILLLQTEMKVVCVMLQSFNRYLMATSGTNHHETEGSFRSDFIPPEHSYIQHDPFSSAFFRDHNQEEYVIQRAFQAHNFTNLRDKIPNALKHGAILQQRISKVQDNTETEAVNRNKTSVQKEEERKEKISRKKREQVGQLGYFEVFPYRESLYGLEHEQQLYEKEKGRRAQEKISTLDFRPAGFDRKMKYEDPFAYVDRLGQTNAGEYIFPFHIPEDTYDSFHQSELRTRIIHQADFLPSKQDKSLSKVSRSKAVDIIKEIQVFLKRHLPNVGFFIGINKKDYVDILFEETYMEDIRLQVLMSRVCESEELSKYQLRRSPNKWGKLAESGYLEYTLLPPWVKDEERLTR